MKQADIKELEARLAHAQERKLLALNKMDEFAHIYWSAQAETIKALIEKAKNN